MDKHERDSMQMLMSNVNTIFIRGIFTIVFIINTIVCSCEIGERNRRKLGLCEEEIINYTYPILLFLRKTQSDSGTFFECV